MQSIAWDLFREFVRLGNQVTVITTSIPGHPPDFIEDGVRVVAVSGTKPESYTRRWWSGSRECFDAEFGNDVYAVLSVSSAAAGLTHSRGTHSSIPYVFQAHGTSWGEFVSKWKSGRPVQWVKSIRNILWLFKDARIYKKYDCIVPVHDLFGKSFRAWPTRVLTSDVPYVVIQNGVDTKKFSPDPVQRALLREKLGWSESNRVLVFVARLHPQKGGVHALRAFAKLGCANYRFLIVGSGEDEMRMRAISSQLRLDDRVRFMGAIPRDLVPAVLAAGDAFAFPSLRHEGLTMNLLEALASGLRPVCSSSMMAGLDSALPIRFADPNNHDEFSGQLGAALREGRSNESLLPAGYALCECAQSYLDLFDRLRSAD